MNGRKSSKGKAKVLDENNIVYQKIAKHLKEIRQEAGYTAAEHFAYENDIARAQYAKYEQGTDMKISSLLKVLAAHNMSIQEFFAGIE